MIFNIKRIIKSLFSFLLVYSGFSYLIYYFIICKQNDRFRILVYHRINDFNRIKNPFAQSMNVSIKDFEKQLKFLKKRFTILPLEKIYSLIEANKALPPKTLAITFDDGYNDNYQNAFPLFMKYQLTATIFLVSDYVNTNKSFWWDEIEEIIESSDLEEINLFIINKLNLKYSNSKSEIYYKLIKYLNSSCEEDKHQLFYELKNIVNTSV